MDSINQSSWVVLIGILSGIVVIKTVWAEVILPIAKFLGIEINTKQHKELQLYKNEMQLFKEEIKEEFKEIKLRLNEMDGLREEGKELQQLILEGVTASLHSLHSQGNNGPVTKAIEKIEEYKTMRAIV